MAQTGLNNQKRKLIADIVAVLSDKNIYDNKHFLRKINGIFEQFKKAYVEPQLQGRDKLVKIKYVYDYNNSSSLGVYDSQKKVIEVKKDMIDFYDTNSLEFGLELEKPVDENDDEVLKQVKKKWQLLKSLTEIERASYGEKTSAWNKFKEFVDDNIYSMFDIRDSFVKKYAKIVGERPIREEDSESIKDLKKSRQAQKEEHLRKRENTLLELISTIDHEYNHSFQDKYMVLGGFSASYHKPTERQLKLEQCWKKKGILKQHMELYGTIVNKKGDMSPAQLAAFFSFEAYRQRMMFLEILQETRLIDEDESKNFERNLWAYSYLVSIGEREARRAERETMAEFAKDLEEFAKEKKGEELDAFSKRVWNFVDNANKLEEENVELVTRRLDYFHKKMTDFAIEDFFVYADRLSRTGKSGERRFKQVVDLLSRCQYLNHIFCVEGREKLDEMFKVRGLDEYAAIIRGEYEQTEQEREEVENEI